MAASHARARPGLGVHVGKRRAEAIPSIAGKKSLEAEPALKTVRPNFRLCQRR
jgi:hypothetical protein